VAEGSVVEDDPGFGFGVGQFPAEGFEEGCGVWGVVGARGTVETVVVEAWVASGFGGEGRAFGWVGGDAGDFEAA